MPRYWSAFRQQLRTEHGTFMVDLKIAALEAEVTAHQVRQEFVARPTVDMFAPAIV